VALGAIATTQDYATPGREVQQHFNVEVRNTEDPTGTAAATGRGVLLPDGTGAMELVRAIDRGAFVQLATQPVAIEYSFDNVSGQISLDNLFFLDSREGDDSRPGDYFQVPGSRLTCSIAPEAGGRCTAPSAPGGEQIPGEPSIFDAGEPFRLSLSPAEALQRIDNLKALRGYWPELIGSRVSAPGFTTVELNNGNEIGQASGGTFYTRGIELVLDGCPIQIVLVQDEVAWFDERFTYRALVTIPADPDLCDPLSPLGVIARGGGTLENGQYAFTVAAIASASGGDADAAQVSFTLTSDIEQSDAVTRRFEIDVKRPPPG
jgi:hypothetical protein